MGRDDRRKARDKNKKRLPQTPRSQILRNRYESEISTDLNDRYGYDDRTGLPETDEEDM